LQYVHRCSNKGSILIGTDVGPNRRTVNRSNTAANDGTDEHQSKPSAKSSTDRQAHLKCPNYSAHLLTIDGTVRSAEHTRTILRSKQPTDTFAYPIADTGPLHLAVPSADDASQRRPEQPTDHFTYPIADTGPLHLAVPSADDASQRRPDDSAKPESDDATVSQSFSHTDSNHRLRGPGCRWRCADILW